MIILILPKFEAIKSSQSVGKLFNMILTLENYLESNNYIISHKKVFLMGLNYKATYFQKQTFKVCRKYRNISSNLNEVHPLKRS